MVVGRRVWIGAIVVAGAAIAAGAVYMATAGDEEGDALARYSRQMWLENQRREARAAAIAPHVQVKLPHVERGVSPAAVRDRVERDLDRIQACYLDHRDPDYGDTSLLVELTIDGSGRAAVLRAEGFEQPVEDCIVALLKGMDFDPAYAGRTAKVRLVVSFTARPVAGPSGG